VFFASDDGAKKFMECSESLLYTAMELNRYRKYVYLPNAAEAQDSSVIKNRYLEMTGMERVPLKLLHEQFVGEWLDYTAKFVQKSLWLEPMFRDVPNSLWVEPLRPVVPLKGRAVTFSDDNSTDLHLEHDNKSMTLRFSNDVDRDAFAYMCASL
jgi:hypothetical protein